ncbi:serglycin isoform X2 [Hemibagrus wyckioides]|uniref:serglycin isoform X2 n=1 Tax=Hemibagrus wyckioides TaxID=337641 RepID=UPI00266B8913|nr:serglycin isoform X2 [Hemibagrus wyckioides]
MRFYYSLTLSALVLLYLISDNVLASKKDKGRYMFVKCSPDSKNANCLTKKGPWIDLQGKPHQISSKDINGIYPVQSSEESFESGDGSGDFINLPDLNRKPRDGSAEEDTVLEGSADYNYISPLLEKPKLTAEDLREDNVIE